MKKSKIFLIILGWQIIGFIATLIISIPTGDFHYFVHELILCLTFTNLVGISGLLLYGFYIKGLRYARMPGFFKVLILVLLMAIAITVALKIAIDIGKIICGLDQYQVNRWHLSILAVNFILLVVVAIITMLLALYEQIAANLESKIHENEKLQRLQIESKLTLLQSKINPHFLFNTLNTILDVLRRNPAQVEKLILNLSDIYRKTLMMPDNALVPLKEEIRLIEEYLEIEKVRMGDRLEALFDIDEKLENFEMPPMVLQILVENAIKHGLSPKKEGGQVRIQVKRQQETVTLEVEDSGIGVDPSKTSDGFGLMSIQQRLKLMYENARMEISSLASGGTQVRICLPYAS